MYTEQDDFNTDWFVYTNYTVGTETFFIRTVWLYY